ncbi:MAG: SurA N-terminal domain-containing protein [Methylophilaceae bacterium]|nr:SurA N-terminal domain-containing protein [Methylophilaceae bacterium]
MLDAIRKVATGWLGKVLLAAITIPFALFGIDTYLNQSGRNVPVAKVNGDRISIQEYGKAIENVRNRLQSEGQKVDPALLESQELKDSVLDGLITKRLVNTEIQKANFKVSDETVSQYIIGMPEFQDTGKFSQDLYDKTLAQNHLTPSKFEAGIRNDLLTQQAREGLRRLVFTPKATLIQSLKFANEQREVTVSEIKSSEFAKEAVVTPGQVKAYYELNKDKFKVPEQVKVQFVLLSAAGLVHDMKADDAEIKAFYNANSAKFNGDEQRHASHILIGFGGNPAPQDKAKAKAKAEEILAQVKKNPKNFEAIAIKDSQDPGSAAKGGDLGSFGRGTMVKAFDDVVFTMKPNQISELVESEYGYHIIKLIGISGQSLSYDSLKLQIKGDILFQKAQAKYAELAEDFSNKAYENSGSLDPVAKSFNLQLETSPWMRRDDLSKFFKNERLTGLVFSNEVLKEKHNTEAVEVSPNNLVSARVLDYKPSAPRTFDEVKSGIEGVLKLEQAAKLAKQKGESALVNLNQGKAMADLDWITPVTIDRKNAQGLSDGVMQRAFKINPTKLPAYIGFEDANKGYVLVKLNAVHDDAVNTEASKEAEVTLKSAIEAEYMAAYGNSLKAKSDITVNRKLLEAKSQN